MPWWVWLLLTLFMVAMLVAGLAYAALHLWRGFRTVSGTGARIGERLAALGDAHDESAPVDPPSFTRPLSETSDRYAEAHAGVVRRRQRIRDRHAAAWARWNAFGDD